MKKVDYYEFGPYRLPIETNDNGDFLFLKGGNENEINQNEFYVLVKLAEADGKQIAKDSFVNKNVQAIQGKQSTLFNSDGKIIAVKDLSINSGPHVEQIVRSLRLKLGDSAQKQQVIGTRGKTYYLVPEINIVYKDDSEEGIYDEGQKTNGTDKVTESTLDNNEFVDADEAIVVNQVTQSPLETDVYVDSYEDENPNEVIQPSLETDDFVNLSEAKDEDEIIQPPLQKDNFIDSVEVNNDADDETESTLENNEFIDSDEANVGDNETQSPLETDVYAGSYEIEDANEVKELSFKTEELVDSVEANDADEVIQTSLKAADLVNFNEAKDNVKTQIPLQNDNFVNSEAANNNNKDDTTQLPDETDEIVDSEEVESFGVWLRAQGLNIKRGLLITIIGTSVIVFAIAWQGGYNAHKDNATIAASISHIIILIIALIYLYKYNKPKKFLSSSLDKMEDKIKSTGYTNLQAWVSEDVAGNTIRTFKNYRFHWGVLLMVWIAFYIVIAFVTITNYKVNTPISPTAQLIINSINNLNSLVLIACFSILYGGTVPKEEKPNSGSFYIVGFIIILTDVTQKVENGQKEMIF